MKGSKIEAKEIRPAAGSPGDGNPILHMRNWLDCIRRGHRDTNCTPENGYRGSIACMLAAQALHTGRRMAFDEKSRTMREE